MLMTVLVGSVPRHIGVIVGGIIPDDGVSGSDEHCVYCPSRRSARIGSTIAGLAVAARTMAN